jgi:hypothetical protein
MAMLLLLSSGRGEFRRRRELAIDFAGDVALESAGPSRTRSSLGRAVIAVYVGAVTVERWATI